jgi:hypothetical protein
MHLPEELVRRSPAWVVGDKRRGDALPEPFAELESGAVLGHGPAGDFARLALGCMEPRNTASIRLEAAGQRGERGCGDGALRPGGEEASAANQFAVEANLSAPEAVQGGSCSAEKGFFAMVIEV